MTSETNLRNKKDALAAARREVSRLESEVDRLSRKVHEEKLQEQVEELATYTGGLNLVTIRDALVGANTADNLADIIGNVVCVIGRGPWEVDEFKAFLDEREFVTVDTDYSFEILALGRSVNDEEFLLLQQVLDYHIESSEPLLVLSQELLVYAICRLENPIETFSEEDLLHLAVGHGGLTAVLEYEGFEWPSLVLNKGSNDPAEIFDFDPSVLSAESPLHRLGYTVAEGRLTTAQRWDRLRQMYEIDGDEVFISDEECRAWGNARTQQRLYAMVRHINWLIGFRGEAAPNASDRWRKDLAWLKESFYRSGMKFPWPSVGTSTFRSSETKASQGATPVASTMPVSSTWPFPPRRS